MAAARRIVGEELVLAPERIVTIVREVLERARRARTVTVRVHPADAGALRRAFGEEGALVEEDPSLERGGCVVATELGELDARLEVKLEELARAMGIL